MLQNLKDEVRECYEHAEECRRRAEYAADNATKQDYLDLERRWLSLARKLRILGAALAVAVTSKGAGL